MKEYGPEIKKKVDSLFDQNLTTFRDKSRRPVNTENALRVKV